ncbi:hypothetical protein [Actinoplanes friuliensis]|uniref:DUF4287 domain-containing protein n=1 Tax=Actinoplanes friuliensis DSM 7358 TaxID=1246995 RepID=U5W189_9ACTN|nr:hypothetical protein [Actinoplanes friuliensis]AGZ41725.1 hypothetical protein AFR_17235 [Actinoplanes friuliensis DSM 7358]
MGTNPRIKPVERATDRTWDEWLTFMDGIDARNLDHQAIALKVYEELQGKVDPLGWWTQAVTVAYEQHIGRRIPGQRPDGTFQTSVSKATKLGMQDLMDRWVTFAATDPDVQKVIATDPRVSGTDRRITWRVKAADDSFITITSEPKPTGTATIVAGQQGLQTPELNLEAKQFWAATLTRFLASVG